jgi:isocitrate lyase
MTLMHLYLVHRYGAESVHFVTPTDDNQYQAAKMKEQGIYGEVTTEVGLIIVANVNGARIRDLLAADRRELLKLIRKQR